MRITPFDIEAKTFPMKFRGFHPEEVSTFLEQIREELEDLLRENASLKDRIQKADEEMKTFWTMQELLAKTLQDAHQVSEEYKIHARREIDSILENAEETVRGIAKEAHSRALRISEEIIELKMMRKDFTDNMRNCLVQFEKIIDTGVMPQKAVSPEPPEPAQAADNTELLSESDEEEPLISEEDQISVVEGHAGEETGSESEEDR